MPSGSMKSINRSWARRRVRSASAQRGKAEDREGTGHGNVE